MLSVDEFFDIYCVDVVFMIKSLNCFVYLLGGFWNFIGVDDFVLIGCIVIRNCVFKRFFSYDFVGDECG